MFGIKVLDCTLRDGGYCNNWTFGKNNIKKILAGLVASEIDVVECGFLTKKAELNFDNTKYPTIESVSSLIESKTQKQMYVCMINYGEYNPEDLPLHTCELKIDGLRVAFHKKDLLGALEVCKVIKSKGYKVFMQPMVSLSYSDEEFLRLIRHANEIEPYAFYIVDSFGVMKRRDLRRMFYLVEHNLEEKIKIGFHSHNNMQLSYSNAQTLVDMHSSHEIIIDASVFGMGRGAGNLNTELFVEYLNDNIGTKYNLKPLLNIVDETLGRIYQQMPWGYSLPNYLSAKHNVHPNYASYLDSKKTLTVENMDEIFSIISDEKKVIYDKKYIEDIYTQYMTTGRVHEEHYNELNKQIVDKEVLIIAPGQSSKVEASVIKAFMNNNEMVSVSVNFDYLESVTDYIFLSNLRRFRELDPRKYKKCIVTSNIPSSETYIQTNYSDLVNNIESVRDNASMMLIKFLIKLGVKKIWIAGLDGYSTDPLENYANNDMSFYTQKAVFEAINEGMRAFLMDCKKQVDIEFLTTPKYVKV